MDPIPVHTDPVSITVDPGQIMQLPDMAGKEGDPYTLELLEGLIGRCREVFSPDAAFLPLETPVEGFKMGNILDEMLRDSEYYVFFIATAGPGPENLARNLLKQGNYLEGFLADLIATRLAEGVADKVHDTIRDYALSRDMKITNRYSPGYCSWNVAEQSGLFRLFGKTDCGISLSTGALMQPLKSVSGVVGMGSGVSFNDYTCGICNKKDCIYRNTR